MHIPRRPFKTHRTMELTALMDVIFILLIFFMLNSQLDQQRSLSIDLPQSQQAQTQQRQHIEITLNALNQIFARGQKMSQTELKNYLEQQDKQRPVMLKADQDASYGKALRIFDLLQSLGYENVALATRPPRL